MWTIMARKGVAFLLIAILTTGAYAQARSEMTGLQSLQTAVTKQAALRERPAPMHLAERCPGAYWDCPDRYPFCKPISPEKNVYGCTDTKPESFYDGIAPTLEDGTPFCTSSNQCKGGCCTMGGTGLWCIYRNLNNDHFFTCV